MVTISAHSFAAHLSGKRHIKKISGRNAPSHLPGASHGLATAQQGSLAVTGPQSYDVPGSLFCAVCKTNIPREAWARHLAGRRHYAKERFAVYRAALDEAQSDKHGVTVSTNGDFGIVETAATGAARSVALTIENTVPSSRITIVDAKLGSIAATTSLSA